MISIGGYHLKKTPSELVEDPFGEERPKKTVEYDLHYGSQAIGWFYDDRFDHSSSTDTGFYDVSEERVHKVRKDMMFLANKLLPFADRRSDISQYTEISEHLCNQAIFGFTYLLWMLNDFVRYANKAAKETEEGRFYVVGQQGSVMLTNPRGVNFFCISNVASVEKGITLAKEHEKEDNRGRLVNLAVLSGKMNWNLSVEEYISLHTV